jgi:hypothetical protein
MNTQRLLFLASCTTLCMVLLEGCSKSTSDDAGKDGPITGRRSDPPAVLKAGWKPGHRYTLRMDSLQTVTLNFGPQPTIQETEVSQDWALVVTNAPGGGQGVDLEIQALVVNSQFGDRVVYRFDSLNKATPNEGPGVELLQRVIGGHVRFLLDSNNSVVKVEGIKELIDRAQGDQGSGAADQRRNWMGGTLERVFNADYFKQLIDLSALPASAVRIGDTWTRQREIDVGMVGRVAVNTTNTLRGWQEREGRKCARLEFRGVLAMKTGQAEGVLALAGLGIQDGRLSGKSWFDPAIGLPIETTLEQSCMIVGSLPNFGRRNNPGQGTNSAPRKVSSPWRQTVTLKLEEAKATASQPPKS